MAGLRVFALGGREAEDHPIVSTDDVKALEKIIGPPYETWHVYMHDGREYFTQTQHIVEAYRIPICPTTPPRLRAPIGKSILQNVSEIWRTKDDWADGAGK